MTRARQSAPPARARKSARPARPINPDNALVISHDAVELRGRVQQRSALPPGTISEDRIDEPGNLGSALKQVSSASSGAGRRNVVAVLPTALCRFEVGTVSAPDQATARRMLQADPRSFLPDIDHQSLFSVHAGPLREGRYDASGWSVERHIAAGIYRMGKSAGLQIVGLKPRLAAELNAAAELLTTPEIAVLNLEPDAQRLIGLNMGLPIIDITLPGLGNPAGYGGSSQALPVRRILDEPDVASATMEQLSQALEEIATHFSRQGLDNPARLLITGVDHPADAVEVAAMIGNNMYLEAIPLAQVEPGTAVAARGALARARDSFSASIISDPDLAPRREAVSATGMRALLLGLPLLLGAGTWGLSLATGQQQAREHNRLVQEDRDIQARVAETNRIDQRNRQISAGLDRRSQLASQAGRLPQHLEAIDARFPKSSQVGFSRMDYLPDAGNLDRKLFDNRSVVAAFSISGDAASRQAINDLLEAFSTSPFAASLDNISSRAEGGYDYRMTIGITSALRDMDLSGDAAQQGQP